MWPYPLLAQHLLSAVQLLPGNTVRDVTTSELGLGQAMTTSQPPELARTLEALSMVTAFPQNKSKIYGGEFSKRRRFKSIVYIDIQWNYTDTLNNSYRQSSNRRCSGTIISPKWVLTAASCLPCHHLYNLANYFERYKISYNIKFGAGCVHLTYRGCKQYTAERFILHDTAVVYFDNCYSIPNTDIDIALIRVKENITFDDYVGSSALFSGPMPKKVKNCIALGFGMKYQDPHTARTVSANRLYTVYVTAGNEEFCRNLSLRTQDGDRVCAHNGIIAPAVTCRGDLGSSLLCPTGGGAYIVVGVTAGGLNSAPCGHFTYGKIYTSSGSVKQWIRQKTENDPSIVFSRTIL